MYNRLLSENILSYYQLEFDRDNKYLSYQHPCLFKLTYKILSHIVSSLYVNNESTFLISIDDYL
jgi:hypothetical protein